VTKSALRDQILSRLEVDLATQTNAALSARDEAISEESKPENQYDMHSQEAAYLAEGQARLAAEIQENLSFYRNLPLIDFPAGAPVALGALVELSAGNQHSWYFIGPRAGGLEVEMNGHTVLVLTPQSPLGRELLGKREGDLVRAASGRSRTAELRVVAVR
jgi:transcription elongation GreA/GreB family factor